MNIPLTLRHFISQALIFVMPLLGVGHILTLLVNPTVRSIGVPLVVAEPFF